MSVRDDGTGLEWAGALGPRAGSSRPAATSPARRTCGCCRDPALPPPGQGRCWRSRTTPDAARRDRPRCGEFLRRRRLHAVLRPALHGAAGRRRLVVRPGASRWTTPRATCSPSSSTTGCSASSARRRGAPSPAARASTSPRVAAALARGPRRHQGDLGPRDRRRRRGHRRQRRGRDVRRGRDRHPPRARRSRCSAEPTDRRSARCSPRCPTRSNTALLHTDTSLLPDGPATPGRRGTSCARGRPATSRRGVTVTYDLTRLQRLRHRHPLPRHPRRRAPRRPGDGDRPDGVRAPALHPRLGRRPAPAARARHRADRLRRGLPRLGLPRGRRALRARRRRATWACPGSAPRPTLPRPGRLRDHDPPHPPQPVPAHLRAPLATWLVDLDDLPDHGVLGAVRGARPPRRARRHDPRQRRVVPRRPRRSTSATATSRHDPDGRAPARVRLLLQPDQRLLVLRRPGAPGGRGRRGAQHLRRPARLPRPPRRAGPRPHRQGDVRLARSTASTARYDVAVPVPTDRLHIAITLRGHRRRVAAFSARLTGTRSDVPVRRTPRRARLRGGALIRAHGIWLWARRLPVRPRPRPPTRKASPMTLAPDTTSTDPARDHWPGLDVSCPPAPAPRSRPPSPAASSAAAVARLDVTVRSSRSRPAARLGRGGPTDAPAPARGVLRPDRPRRPDRLRRGLPDRRLGRRRPRPALPDRARRPACPRWSRSRCSGCAPWSCARPPRITSEHRGQQPAPTSRTTTTCPTSCSRSSSTRR